MGLAKIFSESPVARVLDFFRVYFRWDYSLNDVQKETGVSYRTLQKVIPRLVDMGIIKYTRSVGKAKLYIFNKESVLAKQLQTLAVEEDVFEAREKSEKHKDHQRMMINA